MSILDYLYPLLLSLILCGLIGLERESHGRAAGLRTHILVGISSTLIVLTSIYMSSGRGIISDPGRVAAGVVTGIGFIGAGTIMRFRASIKGLTTAASIWAAAAVGLAIGSGFYLGALVTTAMILFSLVFLGRIEKIFIKKSYYKSLVVISSAEVSNLKSIKQILDNYEADIKDFEISTSKKSEQINLCFDLRIDDNIEEELVAAVAKIKGVISASWFNKQGEVT
ncbi:MAG: MgtC/SapB family protein [Candidatus Kappaea frigidicola]|nr:MgtC/SapB family protein [Candidatus Kappaea frigidicola]